MFVVVADVESHDIEDTIIAEGLLLFIVGEIMFLYPAGAEGVKADGKEEAQQQVSDGLRTKEIPHGGDEYDFGSPVEGHPFIEGFYLPKSLDAEDLEQGIE